MIDTATVLFICSVIACIIGIISFVSAKNTKTQTKAEKDGILEQKINQAIEGINDIKKDFKTVSEVQNRTALSINSHNEQIKTLFTRVDCIQTELTNHENTSKALTEILNVLKELIIKRNSEV